MAIPQDRLSSEVIQAEWLSPDDREHSLQNDFEAGPIALSDPSAGLFYQVWQLQWDYSTGNFIVTPETVGSSSVIINVANVTQCSFCFDQNGRVSLAYTVNGLAYLYWYDTLTAGFVTTLIPNAVAPVLSLDDKRSTQVNASDILLWYTRLQGDGTWNLYKREQRERFLIEDLMAQDTYPYCYKIGMHNSLRGQIGLRSSL